MSRLNQIVAIEKGAKSSTESDITKTYHLIQKPEIFSGLIRTYEPKDDAGEQLPPETQNVIVTVKELVESFTASLTRLLDISYTKVDANTGARADVIVEGVTLLEDVPVEYLLFLEKRLIDVNTFIGKVPTLDPAQDWRYDETKGLYATEPVTTYRTKKILRNHVKAEATDKHPAQVEVYTEDETVGYWKKITFSGAVPEPKVKEWKERLSKVQAAIKFAREEANSIEVQSKTAGDVLFGYVFGL